MEAIAEAAGTNKMTLYRHFDSKDELVAEYLRGLAAEKHDVWSAHRGRASRTTRAPSFEAWLVEAANNVSDPKSRGCALANAAVELPEKGHPARCVIEQCKQNSRENLAALCRRAGVEQPELLADQLFMLLEGALVCTQSTGHEGPALQFRRSRTRHRRRAFALSGSSADWFSTEHAPKVLFGPEQACCYTAVRSNPHPVSVTCAARSASDIGPERSSFRDSRSLAMNVIRRRGWELPESQVTPEHLFFNRRSFVAGAAGAMASILSPSIGSAQRLSDVANMPDPTADLYPAKANTTYPVDRPLTEERSPPPTTISTNSAATRASRSARRR